MKNPIVELITERLVSAGGLSLADADRIAEEVKRWIEDPDAKASKSIYGDDKLIVTGTKDGTLVLMVHESTNFPGAANPDPHGVQISFPEISCTTATSHAIKTKRPTNRPSSSLSLSASLRLFILQSPPVQASGLILAVESHAAIASAAHEHAVECGE